MKLKNTIPKILIDGAIFKSLSDTTLTELGMTAYQLGLLWFKRSGEKSVNSLVEYFTKDNELTDEGENILGTLLSDKYADAIHRMYNVLTAEYEPLENYDRKENFTTNTDGSNTRESSGNTTVNDTLTNNVSAFDSSEFKPESQNINNNTQTSSSNGNDTNKNEVNHEGRTHGNIGITTSQQMINEEIDLRIKRQLIEMFLEKCDNEFLLKVYE